MKSKITNMLRTVLMVPVVALGVGFAMPLLATDTAYAQTAGGIQEGANSAKSGDMQNNLFGANGAFSIISSVLIYVVGAVSVLMLIIGGIRYVLSNGDTSAVTNAKNTILYAIVGIIITLFAFAIVQFIIERFAA